MEFELVYERPTKTKVRFVHRDLGVVYVPNRVYEDLGRPDRLTLALTPTTPELRAVDAAAA